MRKNIILLIVSIFSLLLAFVMLIFSIILSVGNAQSVLATSVFSSLKAIYIFRFGFICTLIFGIILLVLSAIAIKSKIKIKNMFVILPVIIFFVSIICMVTSVLLNYTSNSIYGDYILDDGSYSSVFPYYEDMKNKTTDNIYSIIEENEIYSSKYICLQSSCPIDDDTMVYNVDYFESKNSMLLQQFIAQNSLYNSNLVDEGTYKNHSYSIYMDENSYTIEIVTNHSSFIMYLSNFDIINDDTLIDSAYSIYSNLTQDSNGLVN